ncbi:MAG: hypothetical protein ACOX87_04340 [Chloroflexota bacterium]
MGQPEENEQKVDTPSVDDGAHGWSEQARRWYEELKEQETAIAPWLSLEWTGERMRVRRG